MNSCGTLTLSDFIGRQVETTCDKCRNKHTFDGDWLFEKHGDLEMPSVLFDLAKIIQCERIGNRYADRCALVYADGSRARQEPTEYIPLYRWKETWPGESDPAGNPLQDFFGMDGDVIIGRIRLESHGPTANLWQWSGQGGKVRERLLPHQGYEPTAREASRMVEDYYHRLMRHNGQSGSKDA